MKRVLLLLSMLIALVASAQSYRAGKYRHLDVNYDGHINVADVNTILNAILEGHEDPAEGEDDIVIPDYYAGGDISLLPSYEASGVNYYDTNNVFIADVIAYLKANGWNSMRVRLFVNPENATAEAVGEGVRQDLEYVKSLGARIKAAGLQFVLDFHYSDTWADPVAQTTPAAWASLSDSQLATQVYEYTRDCLAVLKAADAEPDLIQTGNEVSYGMCWAPEGGTAVKAVDSGGWSRFLNLERQAIKACREVCPDAKIILHTELVRNRSLLKSYYQNVDELDYDIIGLSYYPYYHGLFDALNGALDDMESAHPDKDIMIMETGYFHAWQPSDVKYDLSATYPISQDGQKQYTDALVAQLKAHKNVKGLFWWFPEANDGGLWPNQVRTDWYNAGLWDNQTHKASPAIASVGDFAK